MNRGGELGSSVSVVIPTYQSASVIGRAIESVLAQSHPAFEIIVIDDGSTDDTESRVRRIGPPVRYVRQANAGPGPARNHGASIARGAWLAFLDADDLWRPTKLAVQLECAWRHAADAVFSANVNHMTSGGTTVSYQGSMDRGVLVRALLCGNVLEGGSSSLLVRREAYLAVDGFDPGFTVAEDRDLFIRLISRFTAAYVHEPLVDRYEGPVRFGADPQRNLRGGLRIIRRHGHRLNELPGGRLVLRRARGMALRRCGMQYLDRGEIQRGAGYLRASLLIWPFMADPWRAAINSWLGRLPAPRAGIRPARAVR